MEPNAKVHRVLVSDRIGEIGLERLAQAEDATCDLRIGLSREELLAAIPEYDAIIVRSATHVDGGVLAAGRNLKVVGRAGIGVDNIDVAAATERGIIVMNTPQANAIATAEQAMGLMIAASRHTAVAHASLAAGEWRRSDFLGMQLYRKVLGIVGLGRIGRLVAARAQGFGMDVLAFDPFMSEDVGRELGVKLVELERLFRESDFITLHAVVTAETENMINGAAIDQMKDGVVIVNAARGRLIDEQALAQALENGKVKAAALDVYRHEPPTDSPLIGMANVLHTPHLGASTVEAQRDVATQIVDQVLDALRGADYRNAINMPFQAGPDYKAILPYMELAEKLGMLHSAMSPAPIKRVELELRGQMADRLARPVAAALMKGLLERSLSDSVNYINAPVLAKENGISIVEREGLGPADYANLISCRVDAGGSQRLLSGVLFGGSRPRIVQVDDYHLDADLMGIVLLMQNRDTPGVIGQVGTILATHEVNIAEWRMGRRRPGGEALSFISLDSEPSADVLRSLETVPAVTQVNLVIL
jgi:D-3-phosphoglycerate dehydrogenase